ncbi:S-layer homology domain-containing protein [Oscillospiraceae bacterium OttesenSCG-928-F05]|nr:S-layer homology domain-containing protein [Oscillospiraceae bacterium OttesenSCG-928-F05]
MQATGALTVDVGPADSLIITGGAGENGGHGIVAQNVTDIIGAPTVKGGDGIGGGDGGDGVHVSSTITDISGSATITGGNSIISGGAAISAAEILDLSGSFIATGGDGAGNGNGGNGIQCTGSVADLSGSFTATGGDGMRDGHGGNGIQLDSITSTSGAFTATGGNAVEDIDGAGNGNGGNGIYVTSLITDLSGSFVSTGGIAEGDGNGGNGLRCTGVIHSVSGRLLISGGDTWGSGTGGIGLLYDGQTPFSTSLSGYLVIEGGNSDRLQGGSGKGGDALYAENQNVTIRLANTQASLTLTPGDPNGVQLGGAQGVQIIILPYESPYGSGSGAVSSTPTTTLANGVDMSYTINSKGKVTLRPSAAQLEALMETIGADGVLSVAVSDIKGMTSAVIRIDLTKLIASDKLQIFEFSVLDMRLRFPVGALASMRELTTTLCFGLKPGSVVFELTDTAGRLIDWQDYANPVTVSMAYAPPQGVSAHQIVMVREGGSVVPRSWYADGRVYAKVHGPGTYDAAVRPLGDFIDTKGLWMEEPVRHVAARGIVEGVGGELFDRSGSITRAHFVTMLMRALDISDAAAVKDIPVVDYGDVPSWAKEHVMTAAAIGVTLSDEEGKFNPGEAITRQEMFFMAYEAMGACGMLPEMFAGQWVVFSDWENVETDYSDAIQNLAKLGLVGGNDDGTLNPSGTSTRAEGAQFLYNILKYDMQ